MTARVLAWVLEQLQHNSPVVLASVVGTKGSVPGKSGARLAMNRSQNWVGTVGGAGLEHRILNRCKELLQETKATSEVHTFGLNKGAKGYEVQPLDSLCGGQVAISLELMLPMPHILLMGEGIARKPSQNCCQKRAGIIPFKILVKRSRPLNFIQKPLSDLIQPLKHSSTMKPQNHFHAFPTFFCSAMIIPKTFTDFSGCCNLRKVRMCHLMGKLSLGLERLVAVQNGNLSRIRASKLESSHHLLTECDVQSD